MNFPKKTIFLLTLGLILTGNHADAQTCRVKNVEPGQSACTYIEVFEYDYVDVKPEFPGGGNSLINYINSTRRYPQEAYEKGVEGRVTCAFIVNPDGSISNIQLLRGVDPSLNREAMRVIAGMPHWQPGKMNNQTVPVRVVCCIPFRH
ncbi:MAG: energy transducer TonB [Muribaculaceae bacterium]|nr:energy transducer TonB [Muribaculaceae bacterium]